MQTEIRHDRYGREFLYELWLQREDSPHITVLRELTDRDIVDLFTALREFIWKDVVE